MNLKIPFAMPLNAVEGRCSELTPNLNPSELTQGMNTKLKAFVALVAIATVLLPQAEAQNANHTPGNVIGWGRRVVPNIAPGTRFTKIAAGENYSLALKSDGTVVAWGFNEFGQSMVPGGLNGVVAIAAGNLQNLALKADGTVVA